MQTSLEREGEGLGFSAKVKDFQCYILLQKSA